MGPKLRNIQSLKAVSAARKRAPCHRLAISAVASTASGMKKTGRLIGWDGRSRMQGQNDWHCWPRQMRTRSRTAIPVEALGPRSEEHTSELQSLMRISYAVFCLKKKHTKR